MRQELKVIWIIFFTSLVATLFYVKFSLEELSILLTLLYSLVLLPIDSKIKKRDKIYYCRRDLFVVGFKVYKVNKSNTVFDPLLLINKGFNKVILLKLNRTYYLIVFTKALMLRSLLKKLSQVKLSGFRETTLPNIGLSLSEIPLTHVHELLSLPMEGNYLLVIENEFSFEKTRGQLLVKASLFSVARGSERLYDVSALNMMNIDYVKTVTSFILGRHKSRLATKYIRVGWGVDRKREIRITLKPHIGVFGATGMGKTTLLALIAEELSRKGCKVLFINMSGDLPLLEGFKYLIPGIHFGIDPLNSMSLDKAIEVIEESSVAVYGKVGRFSPMVRVVLEEALKNSPGKSVGYIINYLNKWLIKENKEDVRHGIEALLRRLSHLNCSAFKPRQDLCKLLDKDHCLGITLSPIDSTMGKCVFVLTLLNYILDYWNENLGRLYVIIDEVHRLTSSDRLREPILEIMMREGRNKNITLVLASQTLHDIHYSIKANIMTYFFFRLPNPADSKVAASIIEIENARLTNRIASLIQKLPVATCIYYQDGFWELVRIRPLRFLKFNHSPRRIASKYNTNYLNLMNIIRAFTREEIMKMIKEVDSRTLIDLGIMKIDNNKEIYLTNLGRALLEYYNIPENSLKYYTILNKIQRVCNKYGISEERIIKVLEKIQKRLGDKNIGEFIRQLLTEQKIADLNFLKITDFNGKFTKLGIAMLELLNLEHEQDYKMETKHNP